MKKLFGLMLAVLLMVTGVAAFAESEVVRQPGFYLYERRMAPTEEGCVLHLRILMVSDIQYCLENVEVRLLDAQGQEIVPLSVRMEAPVNPVPAGECFFPVTLYCTLPEGSEAADFQVVGMPGEAFAEPSAEEVDADAGHILMSTGTGPAVTAWLEELVTERYMSGYMAVLYIYDVDGNYLGSTTLSWEDAAVRCRADEAKAELAEISGLPEDVLDYYGIDFNEGSYYYLFDNVPLAGLAAEDIPSRALVQTFRTKSPLTVLTSSFELLEDGTWRGYSLLQNGACEPIHFEGYQVILYDAQGNEGSYGSVVTECGMWELEAFAITMAQYRFTDMQEGFVPATMEVHGKVVHEETKYTVKPLEEENYALREEKGRVLLDVTVPWGHFSDDESIAENTVVLWYARHPDDNTMLSCGSLTAADIRSIVGQVAYEYEPVAIPNVPEGITPEMVMFFIAEK